MFVVGSIVIHPNYGLGTVESVSEQIIKEQTRLFVKVHFEAARVRLSVCAEGEGCPIRHLIDQTEIPKVMEHMRATSSSIPTKATDRQIENAKKIRSNNIYSHAEVVRDLTILSQNHKLSPKETEMLKKTRHSIAMEFGHLIGRGVDQVDAELDEFCRNPEPA